MGVLHLEVELFLGQQAFILLDLPGIPEVLAQPKIEINIPKKCHQNRHHRGDPGHNKRLLNQPPLFKHRPPSSILLDKHAQQY
jgi:hypothetical protein